MTELDRIAVRETERLARVLIELDAERARCKRLEAEANRLSRFAEMRGQWNESEGGVAERLGRWFDRALIIITTGMVAVLVAHIALGAALPLDGGF
jgi:hypothetical protein